ncbi:molecular chaperone HscC [Aliikangiella coralliicola]|uniref:Hsp70 family protein n=1 Tax=Aliikangiella coralliicola TaxID=2592383 RepID=A0A545TV25_9GAMM|nr:molecular chaperone HscC [Aliikangiella coralliicola]TQV81075.1 Hsp70 family protein [Aliikangiella coralliicola]
MTHIGIDLGTTNSLIAYWDGEKPQLIPNALGDVITPSAVSIDEDGQILIGKTAQERMISHPESSVAGFKRKMGTKSRIKLGKKEFTAEELSSLVLRQLKQDAEAFLGAPVTEAVISVPAYFNDAQRRATKVAGELAGLKVERLINEPTAAAVAYGVHDREQESHFLVVDLGGGTFDVSVLELFEGVMEVHASAGDNFLGGDDFTNEIASSFLRKHNLKAKQLDKASINQLKKLAQKAKHALSSNDEYNLKITLKGQDYELLLTRDSLEKILSELTGRLKAPIERAIRDSNIRPGELDDVLLVGGATRMPLIRSLIGRIFRRLPACTIDPDQVVALGAAVQAALKSRHKALKDIVMTDICPYTLGVEIAQQVSANQHQSGYFLPVIDRNTTIPVSKVQTLCTIANNQKVIDCSVYQGESRLVKNNIKLGNIEVKVPKNKAGEESVDIRFTYDINGILEVSVKVVSTGEVKRTIIKSEECSLSEKEIEESLKKLEKLKIHPRDQAENRLSLAKAERLFEESLGDKRDYVASLIAQFEATLNSQDLAKISSHKAEFDEEISALEEDVFA